MTLTPSAFSPQDLQGAATQAWLSDNAVEGSIYQKVVGIGTRHADRCDRLWCAAVLGTGYTAALKRARDVNRKKGIDWRWREEGANSMVEHKHKWADFHQFFRHCTGGQEPFPYQSRLAQQAAQGNWPDLLDIPTGLGKTAAVLTSWLWARERLPEQTPRRLVYCLPVRTLVEQTYQVAQQIVERYSAVHGNGPVPSVHLLMGGDIDEAWELYPERPAILVGTQDMLLSRALGRGYAMRRSKWPVHFGLLNSDVLWVFDEPQLMGVAVPTGAQLQALRYRLGAYGPTHTLWMSATLDPSQLDTIDARKLREDRPLSKLELDGSDRQQPLVAQRLGARKRLERWDIGPKDGKKESVESYLEKLADLVADRWPVEGLVLVVLNSVGRAQGLYQKLRKRFAKDVPLALVHGRMRPSDRRQYEHLLTRVGGRRIVVATQAIEAGIDVSATLLVTELAPWPSIVQRCGRCNRYGNLQNATVAWIDLPNDLAPPYEGRDLNEARQHLQRLTDDHAPASPDRLSQVSYTPPFTLFPVLRRKDLFEFFDTTPDLFGDDVDVSPFVRHGDESDVFVYYRDFDPERGPGSAEPAAVADELVRVPVHEFRAFLSQLTKAASAVRTKKERNALSVWTVDPASRPGRPRWQRVQRTDQVCPGRRYLLHVSAGGYDPQLGWIGKTRRPDKVPVVSAVETGPAATDEHLDADPRSAAGRWVALEDHLRDAHREATGLLQALATTVEQDWARRAVELAVAWHDVGKAHPAFQVKLCFDPPAGTPPLPPGTHGPWAKAPHRRSRLGREQMNRAIESGQWGKRSEIERPYFRHELASALAWLAWAKGGFQDAIAPVLIDLVAYLIAAHHGKVRLSIRSVPTEPEPGRTASALPAYLQADLDPDLPLPFARGVWHGDELNLVPVPGTGTLPEKVLLDLRLLRLGPDSWVERTRKLLDHPELGPFRLGYLEALVRVADWRASDRYGPAPTPGPEEEAEREEAEWEEGEEAEEIAAVAETVSAEPTGD